MNRPALFCMMMAGLIGGSALAQQNAEKARLDDFATPAGQAGVDILQVGSPTRTTTVEQKGDRTVETPRSARPVVQTSDQQSAAGDHAPVVQVAKAGDRAPQSAPPLSRREDGVPAPVVRIGGTDRCDPQEGANALSAACRRIIESRAAEFNATEAPRLSAEQELLARQSQQSGMALKDTIDRNGSNNGSPDPEDRAFQELGFLVLSQPRQAQAPADEDADKASLSEALKGVLLQMGVQPTP